MSEIVERRQPLLSIAMCTFNSQSTLVYAVESVIRQQYPDWELIILDNGSRDATCDMLHILEASDPRIKVLYNDRNIGWAHGMAVCLEAASGDYTTFLAADDIFTDDLSLAIVAAHIIDKNNPDVVWVGNYYAEFDGQRFNNKGITPTKYAVYTDNDRLDNIFNIMSGTYYNSMFHFSRIDFLKENGMNFYDPWWGDCESMVEAMCRARSMVVLEEPIYTLTTNTSQTVGAAHSRCIAANQWRSICRVLGREVGNIEDDFSDEIKEKLRYILQRFLKNEYNNIEKILNENCPVRDDEMNNMGLSMAERLELVEDIRSMPEMHDMERLQEIIG